ncbi:MAG: ATP-dependent DNA helicase [Candidatus Thorarchaeota archaeon]
MTKDPLEWFPYELRPYQDQAVILAADSVSQKTVGMLSADCGIGKSIAVLSGYLASRSHDPNYRLFILTRTHSQSNIFEDELEVLRKRVSAVPLTATSMMSRIHLCPNKDQISSEDAAGFKHGCATMIRTGRCIHYWNFYQRDGEGKPYPRSSSIEHVDKLLESGIVTRSEVEILSNEDTLCPYELLRWCAKKSRVLIGPYSYMFKERVRDALLASIGTPLYDIDLLVDEAHNLPDHVLDGESSMISGDDLKWLRENAILIKRETGVEWLNDAVDFLYDTLMVKLDSMNSQKKEIILDRWDVVPRFVDGRVLQLLIEKIRNMEEDEDAVPSETPLDRLVDFLYTGQRTLDSEDWHVCAELMSRWGDSEVNITDARLRIRPLNAAGLIAPVVREARSSLLMSGTFRPLELYAGLMGVRGAMKKDLASPYPKGTRMILIDRDVTTKYTERGPDLWRLLAQRIQTALIALPAQKSALIAFPSYAVMSQIMSYNIDCGYRERLVEDRSARIDDVKELVENGPTAVFMVYGGKFSEGIDLVTDGESLIDLIIGVGIPFSPPTSYQYALKDWYENRFGAGAGYYYSSVVPAIRKVVQLVGRLRRSPDDWGVVLLLDKRFQRHIEMFGKDAVSDLWSYKCDTEMEEAIRTFLDNIREVRDID